MSGPAASYWNRPVSVTSPAYRHTAVSTGISPPSTFSRRKTISQVEDADGSIIGIVPEAVVGDVVVDPDQRRRPHRGPAERAEPVERRARRTSPSPAGSFGNADGGDQRVGPREHRGPPRQLERLVRERAHRLRCRVPRRYVERPEHRAERVRVGVHVARERDRGGLATAPRRPVASGSVAVVIAPLLARAARRISRSIAVRSAPSSRPPRTRARGGTSSAPARRSPRAGAPRADGARRRSPARAFRRRSAV